MADRAQDTEAIRAALRLVPVTTRMPFEHPPRKNKAGLLAKADALAALARLVARLEAAEQALLAVQAGYAAFYRHNDRARLGHGLHELLNCERLVRAALAAAAPGETSVAPGLDSPSQEDAAGLTAAGPGAAAVLSSARWEVGFLVGPCSRDEALKLLEEMSPVVAGRLGAVGAVTSWEERDTPAAATLAEPEQRPGGAIAGTVDGELREASTPPASGSATAPGETEQTP